VIPLGGAIDLPNGPESCYKTLSAICSQERDTAPVPATCGDYRTQLGENLDSFENGTLECQELDQITSSNLKSNKLGEILGVVVAGFLTIMIFSPLILPLAAFFYYVKESAGKLVLTLYGVMSLLLVPLTASIYVLIFGVVNSGAGLSGGLYMDLGLVFMLVSSASMAFLTARELKKALDFQSYRYFAALYLGGSLNWIILLATISWTTGSLGNF
jgi:hypothetical protein